jgi:hypothetical protein
MPCLTGYSQAERPPCEAFDFSLPLGKDFHESAGLGREPCAATSAAAARRCQNRCAEYSLHAAEPIETRPITPSDGLPSSADGSRLVYCRKKAQVVWAHQEDPVPVQPELLFGDEVWA